MSLLWKAEAIRSGNQKPSLTRVLEQLHHEGIMTWSGESYDCATMLVGCCHWDELNVNVSTMPRQKVY